MEVIKFIVAYFDALLLVALAAIYPLRRLMIKHRYPDTHIVVKIESFLRRNHKQLSVLFIVMTALHAYLVRWLTNYALMMIIVFILIGLTYYLKRILKRNWMRLHRWLTVLILILLLAHIIFDVRR